jgi:hypothetical protein
VDNAGLTNEQPLQREWCSICPSIFPFAEALDRCVAEKLAYANTQIDTCSDDRSQRDRCEFCRAEWSDGQIEAQSDTKNHLSHQEGHIGIRKDFSKDATRHKKEANAERLFAANAVRQPGADEATKELANAGNRVEGTLPGRLKYRLAFVDVAGTCEYSSPPGTSLTYPNVDLKEATLNIAPLTWASNPLTSSSVLDIRMRGLKALTNR